MEKVLDVAFPSKNLPGRTFEERVSGDKAVEEGLVARWCRTYVVGMRQLAFTLFYFHFFIRLLPLAYFARLGLAISLDKEFQPLSGNSDLPCLKLGGNLEFQLSCYELRFSVT